MADRSYKLTLSLSDGSTINAGTITAPQGPNGANGATFTPSVSAAGVLSWTNNGGLTNPPPINIKGPKGDDAIITASDVENWGFTKNKGTVTSVAVKMNGAIKGTVTSSGTIDLGTVLTSHQDISGKANLDGGNTFTGKQTLNSPGSDGYSINAAGYVKGSWLQASAIANKGANTGKVCVFDNSGWIYYRTPAEILTEAGGAKASDIPDVSGSTGTSTTSVMSQKATTDELAKKAKIVGGNTFENTQYFSGYSADVNYDYSIIDCFFGDGDNSATIFGVKHNANANDSGRVLIGADDGTNNSVEIQLNGNAGTSGQVLTSQGAGVTPIWGDVTKHGYTQLTNEDLNTIVEVGWYRAAANNSCTNKPPLAGANAFVLVTEKGKDTFIKQTVWLYHSSFVVFTDCYCRCTRDSGNSWGDWSTLQMVDHNPQAFYGCKTFSDGISLSGSLEANNSVGTTGQVLTSQGAGKTPVWKDIQIPDKASLSVPNAKVPMSGKWVSKTWGGYNYLGASIDIWTDGDYIYASNGTSHRKLDKATSTWYNISWKGLTNFLGEYVWTDGNNIYYSNGNEQYVLNKSTSTWSVKSWNGLTNFRGNSVWTDGVNIYYSYTTSAQYVLNKTTSTWVVKNWKGYNNLQGEYVWTDGDNIYYSIGSAHYILDVVTSTWNSKTWNGTNSNLVWGTLIWTDGDNIYCSNGSSTQLQLVKSTVANKTSINSDIKNIYKPITKIIARNSTYVADSSGSVTLPSDSGASVASVVDLTGSLIGGDAYFPFNNGEEGSFTGMIYCEYNTSAGDFEFQINDQIFSCTPASQDITLRVTIDRFYDGYAYSYYYTIISNDGLINNSGFFRDTNRDMYISTSMGSSYAQGGVGTIIKKVL